MSYSHNLLNSIINSLHYQRDFYMVHQFQFELVKNFNIVLRHKKKMWFYFVKILPSDMNTGTAELLAFEQRQVIDKKKSWLKWQTDSLLFLYIYERALPQEILRTLADFYNIGHSGSGNLNWMNVFIEASTGKFLAPQKASSFLSPFKNVIKDIISNIINPHLLRMSQEAIIERTSPPVSETIGKSIKSELTSSSQNDSLINRAITPFYCQLCGERHSATKSKLQCEDCGRYVCLDAYVDMAKVGRNLCPMCDGRLFTA